LEVSNRTGKGWPRIIGSTLTKVIGPKPKRLDRTRWTEQDDEEDDEDDDKENAKDMVANELT
jgi:hypothetical protein